MFLFKLQKFNSNTSIYIKKEKKVIKVINNNCKTSKSLLKV